MPLELPLHGLVSLWVKGGGVVTFDRSRSDERTLEPESEVHSYRDPSQLQGLALVVVWSADEPWRIGELITLPADAQRSLVLGRGPSASGERLERAKLIQQRPGGDIVTGPLTNRKISRTQLRLRSTGKAQLLVQNIGRCATRIAGSRQDEATITAGDTIELIGQLMLYCIQRPAQVPALSYHPAALHAFGLPDAHGIVGESLAVWRLRDMIHFVATRPGHVLVRGPSGAGKELVASAIHRLSARGRRTMVARNAATIPAGLMDAELFGHVKDYPNAGMPAPTGTGGQRRWLDAVLGRAGRASAWIAGTSFAADGQRRIPTPRRDGDAPRRCAHCGRHQPRDR